MSNARYANARLDKFEGPVFPSCIDKLGSTLDTRGIYNDQWLEDEVGPQIAGFGRVHDCRTDDGYKWYASIEFIRASGLVRILFPYQRDESQADGTRRDRSLALYYRNTDQETAERVVYELLEVVRQL